VLDETGCKWKYQLDMSFAFLWLQIIMGLFPASGVEPKTIYLVFVNSPLSQQHQGVRTKTFVVMESG
jgi:hypothetical protein